MEVQGAKITDLKSFSHRSPALKRDGLSPAEVSKLGADFTATGQQHKPSLLSALTPSRHNPIAATHAQSKLDVAVTGESQVLGPVKNIAERLFRAAVIRPFTKLFS